MNANDFIKGIEHYYGPYERPTVKGMVLAKVLPLSDKVRAVLYDTLLETYSTRYGTQPDVAAINDAITAAAALPPKNGIHQDEVKNRILYRDGKPVGHYDEGRLIPWPTASPNQSGDAPQIEERTSEDTAEARQVVDRFYMERTQGERAPTPSGPSRPVVAKVSETITDPERILERARRKAEFTRMAKAITGGNDG